MKRILLAVCLLFINACAASAHGVMAHSAPFREIYSDSVTVNAPVINMDIIAEIESGGDPLAHNGNHVGMYQLSPEVVQMYNTAHDYRGLSINDMYDDLNARFVADWYINIRIPFYLAHYHIPDTIFSRIVAYNWGIGNLKKWYRAGARESALPRETRNYIKKYYQLEKTDEFNRVQ